MSERVLLATRARIAVMSVSHLVEVLRECEIDLAQEQESLRRSGYCGSDRLATLKRRRRDLAAEIEDRERHLESACPS